MFKRLFARGQANRGLSDAIYGQIVAAARQPALYARWQVPDTPLGRFEMMSAHMIVFLHRMRGETGAAAELAQAVTDTFFTDVDHSLRELGIGDLSVPKRMKKLARMFYGRAEAYGTAIDRDAPDELAAALRRNVRPDAETWPEADDLARHLIAAVAALGLTPLDTLLSGRLPLPAPREAVP
ncbi:ubiquinol-cytochrome C chaperone [Aquibium sp. A9E412]|uniref:ubiquinol-cytochrome C chaperone family protein n=1 Tax=Aquibium sp. A9E412 TaxID=2976767 RepID=UPI0025B1E255|nr:ubiquinol-cytochrome C chaperone family protein [Aquibium sp. A9E412]MDN2564948.1 ubiquinol-cytochrome C chaperone [Aquibium sp. A9E412]